MILCTNPNRNSFMRKWVDYALDPLTGIPKKGTEDIIRHFVVQGGEPQWADSREECFELYGKPNGMIDGYGMTLKEIQDVDPKKLFISKTFRFVPMTVFQNPYLLPPLNNSYLANLLAQSEVNQQVFLLGSWTAQEDGASYFKRSWCEMVDLPPENVTNKVRAWDLAASEETTTNKPDWTAGVKMSRDSMGIYTVEHVTRFRKRTHDVLQEIVKTAIEDGLGECQVCIPVDVGAAGKSAFAFYSKVLAENGVYTKKSQMSGHSSKLTRFKPLCALAESGALRVVKADWNEDFFNEMEMFRGERSGNGRYDDMVDAASDAFSSLAKQQVLPTFSVPILTQSSPIPVI